MGLATLALLLSSAPSGASHRPLTLEVEPDCGPGRRTEVTLTGSGFATKQWVDLYFDGGQFANNISTSNGTWTYQFATPSKPPGTYKIRAQEQEKGDVDTEHEAFTDFTIPCPPPATTTTRTTAPPPPGRKVALRVVPPIGPPGFVTRAIGDGFQPGPVALKWDRGLGSYTATANAAGHFERDVLVFHHDLLGRRMLQANGAGDQALAEFLLVPGAIHPYGNVERR